VIPVYKETGLESGNLYKDRLEGSGLQFAGLIASVEPPMVFYFEPSVRLRAAYLNVFRIRFVDREAVRMPMYWH
jgi:hypothetical protein